MSYILEALTRSERERQQNGQELSLEPTVNSQPSTNQPQWLPQATTIITVVAIMGLFSFWLPTFTPVTVGHNPTLVYAPTSVSSPTQSATNSVTAPVATPVTAPVTTTPVKTPAPAQVALNESTPNEEESIAATDIAPSADANDDSIELLYRHNGMSPKAIADAMLAAKVQAEVNRMDDGEDKSTPPQPKPSMKNKPVAATGAMTETVPLAANLPLQAQRRIPTIDYTVHVYAAETGKGFVMLNGRMHYAGDEVAPGLTLERVIDSGVILKMGDTHFRLDAMSSWQSRS